MEEVEIDHDRIALTATQQKHWDQMVKSLKSFNRCGGRIHTVLDTIYGYNGKNYGETTEAEMLSHEDWETYAEIEMDTFPVYHTDSDLSGFADDTHYIEVK